MPESLELVKQGVVGFFWPVGSGFPSVDEDEPERGSLRISESGAEIETLVEDVDQLHTMELRQPSAVIGVSPAGAVLALQLAGRRLSERAGGSRTSSFHYSAATAVGGFDLDRLSSIDLAEVCVHVHGVSGWAGATAIREDRALNDRGTLRSWTVHLEVDADASQSTTVGRGRSIHVEPHWRVDGPEDRREISAPIAIACRSGKPRPAADLIEPLLRAQDLLNFAFQTFVPASAGFAEVDLCGGRNGRSARPWLWNRSLMASHEAAELTRPLFNLATLGGIDGVRRWIALSGTHPRSVQTVVGGYRHGFSRPEMRLLDAASGVETWVRAARPAKWAKGKLYAQQLAQRVGDPFAAFVGDPDQWGHALFGSYNALKHDPEQMLDRQLVSDLAESARILLGSALLDRVARSKEPSRVIFGGGALWQLGERLRAALGA